MSDYDPRPPGLPREPVVATTAGGFYLVGGVLVVLFLIAGLMFIYPGSAPGERNDQARQPDRTIDAATPAPAQMPAQMPTQGQAPTRLPVAPPEGPIQTPPDSVTPTNPQR